MARGLGARAGYKRSEQERAAEAKKPRDSRLIQPGESREAYKARSEAAAKASRDALGKKMDEKAAEGKRRRYGGTAPATPPKAPGVSIAHPGSGQNRMTTKSGGSSGGVTKSRGRAEPGQGGQKYEPKPMSEAKGISGDSTTGGKSKGRKVLSALKSAWRNRDADKSRKEFLDH